MRLLWQPSACHISGGGAGDLVEAGAVVWDTIRACRRGVTVGSRQEATGG